MTHTDAITARLDELQALSDAATPGPWTADERIRIVAVHTGSPINCFADLDSESTIYTHQDPDGEYVNEAGNRCIPGIHGDNARFIAASRTALSQLIAALRAVSAFLTQRDEAAANKYYDTRTSYDEGRSDEADYIEVKLYPIIADALGVSDGP